MQKASHKLSEEIYKQAQAQSQAQEANKANQSGTAGEDRNKDETVVDADFKVDDENKDKK